MLLLLLLTASRAANKSASCQDKDDTKLTNADPSEIIVIILSLLLTATFVAFVISVACLITRHQRQLAVIRYEECFIDISFVVVSLTPSQTL